MTTRRVKAVDYDDDDGYDDYEEDYNGGQDELTEDDKYQLQEGTAKVKSLLGDQIAVTDKEIHDALWHYYYDIEKSVAYLKNSKKPKPAPKVKAPTATIGKSSAAFITCL
jgi:elongation factor 1 alpha-like protein